MLRTHADGAHGGRARLGALLGLGALAASALLIVPGLQSTADAATPQEPAAPFSILCKGETDTNPTSGKNYQGQKGDLTRVDGQRLAEYNAGKVVPLYDSWGEAYQSVFPALCGVRYDAIVKGPVAEWLFCTDKTALVCGSRDAEGRLVDYYGNPVGDLEPQARNARLTQDQETIISYLIQITF